MSMLDFSSTVPSLANEIPRQMADSPASPEPERVDNGDSSSSLDGSDASPLRPDLSYAHLAALAIDASKDKKCTVGEIYAWIESHYPYFKSGCLWWKNCIRHNLSMKKSFERIQGDGVNMWAINPAYYDDLLHNKRRRHSNTSSGVSTAPSKAASPATLSSPAHAARARAATTSTVPTPPSVVVSLAYPPAVLPTPSSYAVAPRIVNVVSVVPASPPKRRASDAAKVPRSPRVRQKRHASRAAEEDECPSLVSAAAFGGPALSSVFDRMPARGPSMEEIWLPGQCRSPSPGLLLSPSAAGVRSFSSAFMAAPSPVTPLPLFSPISAGPRSMFSSTPDFSEQRPLSRNNDNWFSLDFPLQH